jgi:hypothetical protein
MGLKFSNNMNIKVSTPSKIASSKTDSHPSASNKKNKLTVKSKKILKNLGYQLMKNA